MKKILVFALLLATVFQLSAQKKGTVEVYYFKANLACCKAKSCNALENDVKTVVEKYFPNGDVVFKEIKLADAANKELIDKYKAQSQTVIIYKKKKKKEVHLDVSDLLIAYLLNQNKEELEANVLAKIAEIQKM